MEVFKMRIGTVVRLKSCTIEMTVTNGPNKDERWECSWFGRNNEIHYAYFHETELETVTNQNVLVSRPLAFKDD